MKKIFFTAVLAAIISSFAFADVDWSLGVGVGMPCYRLEISDEKFKFNAIDFDVSAYGIGSNWGLTGYVGLSFGAAWTKDIGWAYKNKTDIMYDMRIDLGFGWSPVHTDRFVLSFVGVFGFGLDISKDSGKLTYSGNNETYMVREREWDELHLLYNINAGGEVALQFRVTRHLGIYGRFGIRKVLAAGLNKSIDETRYSGYYYAAAKSTYSDSSSSKVTGFMFPVWTAGLCIAF